MNIKNCYMKKIIFICFLLLPLSVAAQGLYLDVGLGVNYNISTIVYDEDDIKNSYFTYMGINLGFKAGYGPFDNIPLYFVFGYENIYGPIGSGVIFYPISLLQLGLSFGFPIEIFYGNMGFAWDLSAAVNFGRNNHGVLLGIKYWGLTQGHKESGYSGNRIVNNAFGIFVKYIYKNNFKIKHEQ